MQQAAASRTCALFKSCNGAGQEERGGEKTSATSEQRTSAHHPTQNSKLKQTFTRFTHKNNLKALDGGKPRELLRLALNQCLSSQDVIVIPQQVAMEKSLIGSQSETTITRCPKKGRKGVQSVSQQRSGGFVSAARPGQQECRLDYGCWIGASSGRDSLGSSILVTETILCKATSFSKMFPYCG